ncbi:MAG: SBBP repeat-containing protein [Caldilineaceae bacterium]|nr:SBBP repeat-containing protein [Caldilineaceae bacterium]
MADGSVMFIENVGQFPDEVRFQVRGADRLLWLTDDALWVTLLAPGTQPDTKMERRLPRAFSVEDAASAPRQGVHLKLSFVGASPHARLQPFERLETKVSYFIGNDPEQWRPDVPVWGGVRYMDLYPGLDLEVSGEGGRWSWRLAADRVSSASLSAVTLQVEGAEGLALSEDALHLATAVGEYSLPLVQGLEGIGGPAASIVGSNQIHQPFVHAARASLPAPRAASSLAYATFLGGSNQELGWDYGIDVSGTGAAYVTSNTLSSDFPTTPGAFITHSNDRDAFVVKLNLEGTTLVYATFLGGAGSRGIAVDGSGAAYVTGVTTSSDFPTTPGALDTTHNGSGDAFVVKLVPNGTSLAYATFLGGHGDDYGNAIAVDRNGAAYVTGLAVSRDFPTTPGAFDNTYNNNGYGDLFVVKLNPAGTSLVYSTFLGGSSHDYVHAIAVDGSGATYVTGSASSGDFPTTPDAFDTTRNDDGYLDAFVVKLNPAGTSLVYSTFLGGSNVDISYAIAVDGSGAAYVTGHTNSGDFPTTSGTFDPTYNASGDAFVAKLNPTGTLLVYSTFLGVSSDHNGHDYGRGIAVDYSGAAYVAGQTWSNDFPATPGAFDTTYNGSGDAFVAKLNPAGTALAYATFLGGSSYDSGISIAVDGSGAAYITGYTESSNFPTTVGAFDTTYNGNGDVFVVKLTMEAQSTSFISGKITHPNRETLSAVTVWAGGVYSTTTNAEGRYSFPDLPPGEYLLTAQKEGWAFSTGVANGRHKVIIPQENPQSYDFVAVRTPVVFVPGVAGSFLDAQDNLAAWSNVWPGPARFADHSKLSLRPNQSNPNVRASDAIRELGIGFYKPLKFYEPLLSFLTNPDEGRYLEHPLAPVGTSSFLCSASLSNPITTFPTLFVFPYDWRHSNATSAQLLKKHVECIHSYYPDSQINIIAQSMGGLVARRYILDNLQDHHVNKLITVGTPWLGAPKMLNVLENGDFLGSNLKHLAMISKDELRTLVAHFAGAHELIPSRMYCQLNGGKCPFAEVGWDINGQNGDRETYDYDALVNMLNSRYPLDRQDGDTTKPGSNGQTFHERMGQDNWSQVPTDVEYHYIMGIQNQRNTISHVTATKYCLFSITLGGCKWADHSFNLSFTQGDGTVPPISARRALAGQSPSGGNITIHEVRSTGKEYDKQAEHLEMTHSSQVQECLLKILNGETCPAVITVGAAGNAVASSESLAAVEPAYYLTVVGAEWATATDSAGNVTGVISDTYIIETIPSSSYYPLGERSFMLILPTDDVYTTTFRSGEIPLYIELTREGETVTQAVRYQDLELPPNVTTTLTLTPQGLQPLRYDSTGDGVAETEVQPTVSVTGPLAADTTPPTVTVSTVFQSVGVQVTISTVDDTAVARTYYSLDGQQYQEYTAPLLVNVAQSPLIYVFADDTLANRSSLLTWRLGYGIFLPAIERGK